MVFVTAINEQFPLGYTSNLSVGGMGGGMLWVIDRVRKVMENLNSLGI